MSRDWTSYWDAIANGEGLFWKRGEELENWVISYNFLKDHNSLPASSPSPSVRFFVPLCGDSKFCKLVHSLGYSVTALDLVDEAIARQREFFALPFDRVPPAGGVGDDNGAGAPAAPPGTDGAAGAAAGAAAAPAAAAPSTADNSGEPPSTPLSPSKPKSAAAVSAVGWVADNGRVRLWQADMFEERSSELGQIDVVHDKDSFGAIDPSLRDQYVALVRKYCKPGATVLLEAKQGPKMPNPGPPFTVTEEQVKEIWGKYGFELLDYKLDLYPFPGEGVHHQAFLLKLQ